MNSKITHVTQFKSRFRNISPEKVVPQLNLRLGSKLRHSNILEGNDVYFECNIRASPWVHETGWRFEGQELVTNISAGVIVSNQSLVLQKVQRRNRGRYSCTGTNSEGQGESNHVYLRVQSEILIQLSLNNMPTSDLSRIEDYKYVCVQKQCPFFGLPDVNGKTIVPKIVYPPHIG
ncbi:uncharacterized protein TNCT_466341 [Trichonephila clavata]|uniref:Ig-like domain-containing protein n=1 Tax=Trichonephila clavata TaxID=2740835 RepID=A0A8X6H5F2_TRICU|nr:uncharacterized protein TNCT_466341 [Trichonephila clavata]